MAVVLDAARDGERSLVPAIFEPLARELLLRADVAPGDRLLDLACASAIVARCARSRGVDFAVGLDRNDARLRSAPPGSAVALCQGDAVRLPFRDGAFTVVACQHGLQFISDREASLAESYRVLAPGGRLVASAWCSLESNPGFLSLDRAIGFHVGSRAQKASAVPFSLPDAGELADEFLSAGFVSPATFPFAFDLRFPSSATFVQRFVRSTSLASFVDGGAVLGEVSRTVEEDLRRYERAEGLVLPGSAYFVIASRGAR